MLLIGPEDTRARDRAEPLLERLRAAGAASVALEVYPIYLADAGPAGREALPAVLDAEPAQLVDGPPDVLDVTPRPGMVSPWSSKAQDILQRIGVHDVRRLERGRRYRLSGVAPELLDPVATTGALHDRMTEALWHGAADAGRLFAVPAAATVASVPLQAQGRAALGLSLIHI